MNIEPFITLQFRTLPGATNNVYGLLQINTSNWTIRSKQLFPQISEISAPTISLWSPNIYKVTWSIRYTQDSTIRNNFASEIQLRPTSGASTYTGDGEGHFQYYGVQTEVGSFPTSYIPTTNSTVTRTADKASITGSNFSNWFNNNEFSIFTHHKFPSVPPNYYPRVFDINTGNDAYRINHYHDPSIYGTKVGCSVVENNSAQYAQATSSYDIGDDLRMASCFKDNDFASYANGALIGSTDDTGVFTTTQRTVLYIGSTANAGSPLNGTISQLTYYPRRLSNDNLQNLTK